MNATTVKPLPSIKTATADIKCTMAAEESYKVWYQMMREMADKDIKRERELENAKRGTELANNMLAAQLQKQKECEDEIKRLKHELHKAKESESGMKNTVESLLKGCNIALNENQTLRAQLTEVRTNTQNIPKNDSNDALDALKRITEVDVSGRNAWTASNIMKKIAKEVLGGEADE